MIALISQSIHAQPSQPVIVTVKPALPKVVRHAWCKAPYANTEAYPDLNDYVSKCIKDGYKVAIIANYGRTDLLYVVAEKY